MQRKNWSMNGSRDCMIQLKGIWVLPMNAKRDIMKNIKMYKREWIRIGWLSRCVMHSVIRILYWWKGELIMSCIVSMVFLTGTEVWWKVLDVTVMVWDLLYNTGLRIRLLFEIMPVIRIHMPMILRMVVLVHMLLPILMNGLGSIMVSCARHYWMEVQIHCTMHLYLIVHWMIMRLFRIIWI